MFSQSFCRQNISKIGQNTFSREKTSINFLKFGAKTASRLRIVRASESTYTQSYGHFTVLASFQVISPMFSELRERTMKLHAEIFWEETNALNLPKLKTAITLLYNRFRRKGANPGTDFFVDKIHELSIHQKFWC